MTSLEKKVLQCASGEKRLKPDELRHYFGTYIKTAQALNISATIVDEAKAHSPYGIIVHSDKAENLDKVLFSEIHPDILAPQKTEQAITKKGFFAKLFGK